LRSEMHFEKNLRLAVPQVPNIQAALGLMQFSG
jgi:hypothetical protein